MIDDTGIGAISHAIQLSVAPVFLLSGIAGLLSVMTARLSRIVDRARVIEHRAATSPDRPEAADERQELVSLSWRARVISHSIGLVP